MENSNEIELMRLYEEATFVILMTYDHHKKSRVLMEKGRLKTALDHVKIVLQNAERLQATMVKVMAGLEENSVGINHSWVHKLPPNEDFLGQH